jgi:hypothetical protein
MNDRLKLVIAVGVITTFGITACQKTEQEENTRLTRATTSKLMRFAAQLLCWFVLFNRLTNNRIWRKFAGCKNLRTVWQPGAAQPVSARRCWHCHYLQTGAVSMCEIFFVKIDLQQERKGGTVVWKMKSPRSWLVSGGWTRGL